MTPTDKMAATGAAGAAALLVAWLLSLAGVAMPAEVQLALGLLLAWLAGYIKTERGALAALVERRRGKHG